MTEELEKRGHIAGFYFEDHELIIADGHDNAIIGVSCGAGDECRVCYSRQGVIDNLVDQGMDSDEAEEFFEFNIAGAYVGPGTPQFLVIDYELISKSCPSLTPGTTTLLVAVITHDHDLGSTAYLLPVVDGKLPRGTSFEDASIGDLVIEAGISGYDPEKEEFINYHIEALTLSSPGAGSVVSPDWVRHVVSESCPDLSGAALDMAIKDVEPEVSKRIKEVSRMIVEEALKTRGIDVKYGGLTEGGK